MSFVAVLVVGPLPYGRGSLSSGRRWGGVHPGWVLWRVDGGMSLGPHSKVWGAFGKGGG